MKELWKSVNFWWSHDELLFWLTHAFMHRKTAAWDTDFGLLVYSGNNELHDDSADRSTLFGVGVGRGLEASAGTPVWSGPHV